MALACPGRREGRKPGLRAHRGNGLVMQLEVNRFSHSQVEQHGVCPLLTAIQCLTLSVFVTENSGHMGSRELAWLCKPSSSRAGGNHRRAWMSPTRSLSQSLPKGRLWGNAEPGCRPLPPSPRAAQSHWQRDAWGCPIPTATSCRLQPTSIFQAAAARAQSHLPPAPSSWLMAPKALQEPKGPLGTDPAAQSAASPSPTTCEQPVERHSNSAAPQRPTCSAPQIFELRSPGEPQSQSN